MRIVDVLPLTPLQQDLLVHSRAAPTNRGDVYAAQVDITLAGAPDPHRLRDAVQTVVRRHPHLAARFSGQFDEPVQIIPADPMIPWQYLELDSDEEIRDLCAAERRAVCDLDDQPAFRVALIRAADGRHRFVLTNHPIVVDGWSMPILLQEVFAAYDGQQLPDAVPYRKFVDWQAERDLGAARAAWREVLAGVDTPTLVGPRDRLQPGPRRAQSSRLSEETSRAVKGLARSQRTTVSTVLQAAWAQVLTSLTGQRDITFGLAVSNRPTGVAGAESMVGQLINTVPMRAHITPDTTTVDLLDQLHRAYSRTLEHQHLALSEIHRVAGHDRLFDALFVYENYPINAVTWSGDSGLAVTDVTRRDHNLYPLTLVARPGEEMNVCIEYDVDVFDEVEIVALIERLRRVLKAIVAEPTRRLSWVDLLGQLDYLGRTDEQFKIHDYRIQLGEIQTALAGLDGVDQAVVVPRGLSPADLRLIGYVTESRSGTIDPAELRAALAQQLPGCMVPAAVVVLASLPLTANGRLDIPALPAPEYC
jgi:hypothetical protein